VDIGGYQLVVDVDETGRRKRRKRNNAFRRRIREEKAAKKEGLYLRLTSATAIVAWALVGIQYFR
jgi:hypothetical protein